MVTVCSISVNPSFLVCIANFDFSQLLPTSTEPREDARLRGDSLIKPRAKVPRQNESRSDVT